MNRVPQGAAVVFSALGIVFLAVILLPTPIGTVLAADPPRENGEETQDILEEIRELYESAREKGEQVPKDLYDWIRQDLQSIGDWEYRIVEVARREATWLQARLNDLGTERWEVIWIEPQGDGARIYCKRPVRSYLSQIPLSQLMKILPGGGAPAPGE
jgi:hypothetical protein